MYHFRYKGKVAPNVSNYADPWISQIVKGILEGEANVAITAKRAGCSIGTIYRLINGQTVRPMRLSLDGILRANGQRMAIVPIDVTPAMEIKPVKRFHYNWSPKDIVKTKAAPNGHKHKGIDVAKRRKPRA